MLKSYRRPEISRGPLLRWRAIRALAAELIERYRVAAPGPHTPARDLSGGNLQKLVLGRELTSIAPPAASQRSSRRGGERQTRAASTPSEQPSVLIAASPTRGLDVGAIETVHTYLRRAAADRVAVVLISEDLDEIRALADRILVVYEGRITGEFDPETATVGEIGLAMAGGERA